MNCKILLISCLFFIAGSCKKREYPDEKTRLEKEDIFFSGLAGNEPIDLKIGTDGYYCYSSNKQRADSIYVFEGELRKYNCNPCQQALRVELSDYRARVPGASIVKDSSFRNGPRHFIPGLAKTTTLRFESHSNKPVAWVRWDLSNGNSTEGPQMSQEFGHPGVNTVSLSIKSVDQCESRVVNKIYVGGSAGIFACGVTVETVQGTSATFKGNIIGGKGPFRYSWSFGDGNTSSDEAPNHSFQWSGSYPVKLRIVDAEEHVCESEFIHIAGNDRSSCAANMSLMQTGTRNSIPNGVRIQWIDRSGATFRSDSIEQSADGYFEILRSEDYEPNERGEQGRLLTMRFNVLLSDGTRKLWFRTDNAVIAVTYK